MVGNPFTGFYQTVATADFNRDGKPDLLVINGLYPSQSMAALLGNNQNQYVSKTVSDSASQLTGAAEVADVNGDAIMDIVTASQGFTDQSGNFTSDGAIDVYLGNGDGTFEDHVQVSLGQYLTPFLVDINSDGKPDLVVRTYPNGSSTIQSGVQAFLNDGRGGFTACTPLILYSGGAATSIVAAGNITHQGAIDLIVGPAQGPVNEASGQSYQILNGAADGTFRVVSILPYQLNPAFFYRSPVADYNGDGYPDFPLLDVRNNRIVMLLGSKAGTLNSAQVVYIPAVDNFRGRVTADFNGDGET